MCGNIKKLRFPDRLATEQEVNAAVLQFVRKISHVRAPSPDNKPAFDDACDKIALSVRTMLDNLKGRSSTHHPHLHRKP